MHLDSGTFRLIKQLLWNLKGSKAIKNILQFGGTDDAFKHYGIFGVAALVGIGGSAMLITSLTLTAELIGPNTGTGAFVYGAMSLCDKFSNGAAFALVQRFIPPHEDEECHEIGGDCRSYFRLVLFAVCGGAALAAILVGLTMLPLRHRRKKKEGSKKDLIEADKL